MKPLKILSRIGLVLLIVVAAVLVVRAVLNYMEGRALGRELAALKAQGIPLTAKDLAPPCADEDNAARLWKAAENLLDLTNAERGILSRAFLDLVEGGSPAGPDRAAIAGIVSKSQRPLALIHEIAAKPCFLYRNPETPLFETMIPSAVKMITATRLLAFEAYGKAETGDVPGALSGLRSGLKFAAQIASEGTLIAQLIAVADTRILVSTLGVICRDRPIDEPSLLGVIGDLEPEAWRARLAEAIKGERTMAIQAGLRAVTGPRKKQEALWGDLPWYQGLGAWLIRPLLTRDLRSMLGRYFELERQARRPYYETRGDLRQQDRLIQDRPWYAYLSKLVLGNFEAAFLKEAQVEAVMLASRTGLACRLYKSRNGRYPERVEELVPALLPEVPIDPFSGKPLVFRREGEGFVVYSLGSNQKDDGGRSTYMIDKLVMDKDDDWSWKEDR